MPARLRIRLGAGRAQGLRASGMLKMPNLEGNTNGSKGSFSVYRSGGTTGRGQQIRGSLIYTEMEAR